VQRALPHVDGVEHSFIQVNGFRMHVAEAGSGPPVVLLHGWPQHWYEWRKVIGPLAERYRVICPDLRGFGWSEAAGGSVPDSFVADTIAMLDALGIEEPVRLAGHDWGGWTGFLLCLRHPERFSHLLALNILHPIGRPTPGAALPLWRFWYQAVIGTPGLGSHIIGRPGFENRIYRWVGVRPEAWSEEELHVFLDQFQEPARARASAELYRNALLREVPRTLLAKNRRSRLTTPTLLLFGTDDKVMVPASLEGYERRADDMRVELVPGAGHFIVDERPELVAERALTHFGS
jgi:pimeloyl-ACP methyl ester carboxylesterase